MLVSLNSNIPVDDPSKGEQIAQVVVSNYEDFKSILESSKKDLRMVANYSSKKI